MCRATQPARVLGEGHHIQSIVLDTWNRLSSVERCAGHSSPSDPIRCCNDGDVSPPTALDPPGGRGLAGPAPEGAGEGAGLGIAQRRRDLAQRHLRCRPAIAGRSRTGSRSRSPGNPCPHPSGGGSGCAGAWPADRRSPPPNSGCWSSGCAASAGCRRRTRCPASPSVAGCAPPAEPAPWDRPRPSADPDRGPGRR